MATLILAILALVLILAGAATTFLVIAYMPTRILQRAHHGRFAGLSASEPGGGSGKAVAVRPPKVGKQVLNVC